MPIVVDLPAPFGPSRPNTSPGATSKSIPLTASIPPGYVLRSCETSTAGTAVCVSSVIAVYPFACYGPCRISYVTIQQRNATCKGRDLPNHQGEGSDASARLAAMP